MSFEMPGGERSREQGNREGDERLFAALPEADEWSPTEILSLPPSDGAYRYRNIAEYVNGVYQDNNIARALAEGYRAVDRSEIPEHMGGGGSGPKRDGGLIAMKIPEGHCRQREAYYQNQSQSAVHAANVLQGVEGEGQGQRALPVYQEDRSRSLAGADAQRFMTEG